MDTGKKYGLWALASALISQQSILKQGFQKTHFPMVLEVEEIFFLLSIWLTSTVVLASTVIYLFL